MVVEWILVIIIIIIGCLIYQYIQQPARKWIWLILILLLIIAALMIETRLENMGSDENFIQRLIAAVTDLLEGAIGFLYVFVIVLSLVWWFFEPYLLRTGLIPLFKYLISILLTVLTIATFKISSFVGSITLVYLIWVIFAL